MLFCSHEELNPELEEGEEEREGCQWSKSIYTVMKEKKKKNSFRPKISGNYVGYTFTPDPGKNSTC